MLLARPICFRLEMQLVVRAFSRTWANTGKRIAARMAIMAITTSNSVRENVRKPIRMPAGPLNGHAIRASMPANADEGIDLARGEIARPAPGCLSDGEAAGRDANASPQPAPVRAPADQVKPEPVAPIS